MKKIILFIIIIFLFSCTSTPVIIKDIPKLQDVSSDISDYDLIFNESQFIAELKKYIDDLISEIKAKVPFVDLRNKDKK